jgi:hypothetical protein
MPRKAAKAQSVSGESTVLHIYTLLPSRGQQRDLILIPSRSRKELEVEAEVITVFSLARVESTWEIDPLKRF